MPSKYRLRRLAGDTSRFARFVFAGDRECFGRGAFTGAFLEYAGPLTVVDTHDAFARILLPDWWAESGYSEPVDPEVASGTPRRAG